MTNFRGPRLKIKRAKKHITELHNEVVAYVSRHPYLMVVQQDADPEYYCWVLRIRENIPEELSVILGDIVHNLRASLDILACELVRLNGADTHNVYFPFSIDQDGLEDAISRTHFNRAAPAVVDTIRTLKPYRGGNEVLRGVHDLDIMDKHKLLIPCSHFTGIPGLEIRNESKTTAAVISCRIGPVQDGQCIMRTPIATNIEIGQEFDAAFAITLSERPFNSGPIVPMMHELTQVVAGIVSTFEGHYP
jgi:hypothetical protein